MLRQVRRYAIVGIFALAAVLTPPDLFSMLSLARAAGAALRGLDLVRRADRETPRRGRRARKDGEARRERDATLTPQAP